MGWPTTPNVTFNVSKWPSLSLTLKTDSLSLSLKHIHTHTNTRYLVSRKHLATISNTLSKAVPGATVQRNPICMQEAWPGQTKLVVTLQREAVNHTLTTVWESEHSENTRA